MTYFSVITLTQFQREFHVKKNKQIILRLNEDFRPKDNM